MRQDAIPRKALQVFLGREAWSLVKFTSLLCGRPGLALLATLVGAWSAPGRCDAALLLRGRRVTYGIGLALVAALVGAWSAPGVALGDICFRFLWQVWHLVTSTSLSCGNRDTYGIGLALVAALVGAWSALQPRVRYLFDLIVEMRLLPPNRVAGHPFP
eukprot:s3183_g10.t1